MQPRLAHTCSNCSLDTTVPFTASVFSEQQYCPNCGYSSAFSNPAETTQMVPDKQHDELTSLFSRQMTFTNLTPPPDVQSLSAQSQYASLESHRSVYPSIHYTHTYHLRPARESSPPSPVDDAIQMEIAESKPAINDEELAEMLTRNGINPALLSLPQVNLFRNADYDQRLRLLELWRISPPTQDSFPATNASGDTDLRREEEMARLRYDHQASQKHLALQSDENIAMAPEMAVSMTRTRSSSAPLEKTTVEPYMMSGYELLASRDYEESSRNSNSQQQSTYVQATDPAYNNPGSNQWQQDLSHCSMENAYGHFETMHMKGGLLTRNGLDEEMIL